MGKKLKLHCSYGGGEEESEGEEAEKMKKEEKKRRRRRRKKRRGEVEKGEVGATSLEQRCRTRFLLCSQG